MGHRMRAAGSGSPRRGRAVDAHGVGAQAVRAAGVLAAAGLAFALVRGRGEAAGGMRVQIGRTTVDAAAHEAVVKAIAEANERNRVAGLADELTPGVIDVAKAEALVAGLLSSGAASLGGRALILD